MDAWHALSAAPRAVRLAAACGTAVLLGACAAGPPAGDKAGAAEPPVTLTLGSPDAEGTPGTDALKHFAEQVSSTSGGRITIQFEWNAARENLTDVEGNVIHQVQDGRLDLGWVGTRSWDQQGITGFAALQAPFLITDYGVLDAVTAGDMPGRMLAELDGLGLTGLGVYPDQLRHPLGFREPFLTLDDFQGARIRVPASKISDEIVRSLGAVPVNLNGPPLAEAMATGQLVGAETSIGTAALLPAGSFMTMNVTFYPKLQTLFAATDRFGALSATTRSVLQAAASDTLAYLMGQDPESADIAIFCELGGTLYDAAPDEVERMEMAAEPVMRELETDASIAGYIGEIKALLGAATPQPPAACPGS